MKSRIDKTVLKRLRADIQTDAASARADAVEALAALGDRRGLLRALQSDDPYLRRVALRGLARLKGERIAWRLAQRIRDRDVLVRRHAAFALGQRGEWIARFALRRLIVADGSFAVRCEALAAYAETRHGDVSRILIATAEADAHPEVRELAEALLARRPGRTCSRCSGRATG